MVNHDSIRIEAPIYFCIYFNGYRALNVTRVYASALKPICVICIICMLSTTGTLFHGIFSTKWEWCASKIMCGNSQHHTNWYQEKATYEKLTNYSSYCKLWALLSQEVCVSVCQHLSCQLQYVCQLWPPMIIVMEGKFLYFTVASVHANLDEILFCYCLLIEAEWRIYVSVN